MCGQTVRCVHEDFGNAQAFLDGLELESQQVAVDAFSFKSLHKRRKTLESGIFLALKENNLSKTQPLFKS